MKLACAAVALLMLFVGLAWTQEQPQEQSEEQSTRRARGAVSLQAAGSLVAPAGVEVEFFLGSVGLTLETRFFVRRLNNELAGTLEPGVNLRFYFGGLENSLFFFAGADFLTVWRLSPFSFEQGIVKPRTGLGYHRLLGDSAKWRLGLEIGAAWLQEVLEGDQGDLYEPVLPLLPHFMLVVGRAF